MRKLPQDTGLLCGRSPARDSLVDGSKELAALANENANWASYYLDYKALKQILGQLTPPQLEAQTEGNAQVRRGARTPSPNAVT